MSRDRIIFSRGVNRLAVGAFALALFASVKAQEPILEVKNYTRKTNTDEKAYLPINGHVIVGCLDPSRSHTINLPTGVQVNIPSGLTHFEHSFTFVARPGLMASYSTGDKPLTGLGLSGAKYGCSLFSTQTDLQEIQVRATGMVKNTLDGPTAGYQFGPLDLVWSLKPGGPADGKARIPQVLLPDSPEDEGELVDIFSDLADYYVDPSTSRVLPQDVPDISINDGAYNPGPGVNWNTVRVPSGSVPSSGSPPWISTPYPRTIPIGGGEGGRKTFFVTNQRPGGVPQSWDTGVVNRGPDGGTYVNVYQGEIDSQNYGFPPGYKPSTKDLMPPKDPGPSTADVDPCFSVGMTWLGLPPPGVTPGGEDPLPPGVTPGGDLPAAPGLPGGAPGTPSLPADVEPGVPGSPGTPGTPGGQPVDPPTIPGPKDPSGGGGSSVGPPKGGDVGDAPSEPGGPLPGPDEVGKETRGIVKQLRATLDVIQQKASGFRQWGKVTPAGVGTDSAWTVNLTIAGTAHTLTIPTDHAPTVRAVLKVVLTALALVAIANLLLK